MRTNKVLRSSRKHSSDISPPYSTLYEPDASLLWTKENVEPDDYLHNTGDPALERMLDKQVGGLSPRGLVNVSVLAIVIIVIVGLFAGWPIYSYAIHGEFPNSATSTDSGWGLGGVNATGQVPKIEGLPGLIDDDTPMDVRTRTGFDGKKYDLVFSDEVRLRHSEPLENAPVSLIFRNRWK